MYVVANPPIASDCGIEIPRTERLYTSVLMDRSTTPAIVCGLYVRHACSCVRVCRTDIKSAFMVVCALRKSPCCALLCSVFGATLAGWK